MRQGFICHCARVSVNPQKHCERITDSNLAHSLQQGDEETQKREQTTKAKHPTADIGEIHVLGVKNDVEFTLCDFATNNPAFFSRLDAVFFDLIATPKQKRM